MNLFEQLTLDELENWDLKNDAEDYFTMTPNFGELKDKQGILRVDRIPKQNFHPEKIISDFFADVYGEPLKTVPIDRRKTYAIIGLIFSNENVHRYVIAKVNKGKEYMFIARIELDVVPTQEIGDFWSGDHTREMDGLFVDTGELIPYAMALQTITYRRRPTTSG